MTQSFCFSVSCRGNLRPGEALPRCQQQWSAATAAGVPIAQRPPAHRRGRGRWLGQFRRKSGRRGSSSITHRPCRQRAAGSLQRSTASRRPRSAAAGSSGSVFFCLFDRRRLDAYRTETLISELMVVFQRRIRAGGGRASAANRAHYRPSSEIT